MTTTCDFCGGTNAQRMEIPVWLPAEHEWMSHVHPLTGNVCPRCLPGQMQKALNHSAKVMAGYDGAGSEES